MTAWHKYSLQLILYCDKVLRMTFKQGHKNELSIKVNATSRRGAFALSNSAFCDRCTLATQHLTKECTNVRAIMTQHLAQGCSKACAIMTQHLAQGCSKARAIMTQHLAQQSKRAQLHREYYRYC